LATSGYFLMATDKRAWQCLDYASWNPSFSRHRAQKCQRDDLSEEGRYRRSANTELRYCEAKFNVHDETDDA
jgi:hypothetical protein